MINVFHLAPVARHVMELARAMDRGDFIPDECPVCDCTDCIHGHACRRVRERSCDWILCPFCGCVGNRAIAVPPAAPPEPYINDYPGEENSMDLKSKLPKEDGKKSKFVRRPFLKDSMVPKTGAKVTIVGVREATEGMYSDLLIDLRLAGKEVTWGVNFNQPNVRILSDRFGTKTEKWYGKTFQLQHKKWSDKTILIVA